MRGRWNSICFRDETLLLAIVASEPNMFFRSEMQHIINGLDGHNHEAKLDRPLGYLRTTTLQKDANKIVIHKYSLLVCHDKTKTDIDWTQINLKAIIHLIALERSFVHFIAYLFHASNGYPHVHFQISSKELYALRQQTGHFGLRHYSEPLNKALEWTLGSNYWFKDPTTLINVHNFLVAILKRNFGESKDTTDFISPILLRANGVFEIEQLNIFQNLIATLAGPVLKDIPSLVSFYNAYEIVTQSKQIIFNIEIIASAKFTGMSTVINSFYATRSLSLYRLFNKEMIQSMGCGTHAQDSQVTDSPISFGGSYPNDLIAFTPPGDDSSVLNARIPSESLPDPTPKFNKQASQAAIKDKLNWDDVFGSNQSNSSGLVKPTTNNLPPANDKPASTKTVANKVTVEADVICGENSDDYFSDSMEFLEGSTVVIGSNENKENEPVFPIPTVLTTDSDLG